MREIKFKVWDGEQMRILEKRNYLGFTGIVDQIAGHEGAKWLEFTGLKDKNGVEIYEGDVVKRKHFGTFEKFEVVFSVGFFLKDDVGELWGIDSVDGTEVVGNVFDNPNWNTEL